MLTPEQQRERINQLRDQIGQVDYPLTDESGAKDQLVKTFEWRKSNGIDLHPVATRENKLPVLYAVRGYESIPDSNLEALPGVSESVLRINKYMGGTCLHKTDREGFEWYHIACTEFLNRVIMKDCSKKAGRIINRETVIFDCTGMGWHQLHMPALNYIRAIAHCDQNYYPETLNKLFLINAPSAFVYVWKIAKTWLDPGTIAKIQILGSDYKDTLLKQIPPENLPSFLGGECTCEHMDGGCVPSQARDDNEKVSTAYNTSIMNEAKTSAVVRGPSFYGQ
ncbi:CRAL/TRIO domain-containing protein [Rhizopus microsporus]|uniref:CRAL/TRIO domain-containing protein n=1 Tax=Rhizopus microsporus TaxID=58291 RepID=A0A1X0S3Q8_RHIZD|nr:CRAL/TRIO domain-containing protein [Rhizopus microsporus]